MYFDSSLIYNYILINKSPLYSKPTLKFGARKVAGVIQYLFKQRWINNFTLKIGGNLKLKREKITFYKNTLIN